MESALLHPPSCTLHPRRILVRGVNWLGDAVMTTPALMRLRERFPEAHIAMLTPEKLAGLWLNHPAVDEIISFAAGEGLLSVSRKLRGGGFDLALVLPNSPRSALETWLARIPKRVGYARPWRNVFLTASVPSRAGAVKMRKRSVEEIRSLIAPETKGSAPRMTPPTSAHQIYEYLHLTAALGANAEPLPPQLAVTSSEVAAALAKFGFGQFAHSDAPRSGADKPVFGLNAGAEYGPAKRWPDERFIAAAREIQSRTNCTWLILGGKGDIDLAARIAEGIAQHASRITLHNLAGKTSLRELMAILKLCRVLLTNDTGPMHVAAALGTPVVVPFGSTSPELTGPGLPGDPRHQLLKSDAPCSPCFLRECPVDFRCMNGIGVDTVVEAALKAAVCS